MLANSTSANAASPGDIRKIMSTPDKGKYTSNKKQVDFNNEGTMNGKTYWECSQHVIFYAKKSSSSSMHSLVERVDNGGVTVSGVRFIETHPNRKVYIHGTDNHQISVIPLATE